jgi:hypothetical protein
MDAPAKSLRSCLPIDCSTALPSTVFDPPLHAATVSKTHASAVHVSTNVARRDRGTAADYKAKTRAE